MKSQYPVLYDGTPVGEAKLEREGLYIRIRFRCRLDRGCRFRMILHIDAAKRDLGLCASDSGIFEDSIRILLQDIENAPLDFSLEKEQKGRFVPIRLNEPFLYPALLHMARFQIQDGVKGLILQEL